MPVNTQLGLRRRVRLLVGQDGRIGNRFNQSCPKDRSRDSENNVWIPALASKRVSRGQKIELDDIAARERPFVL
jgi:hypothetical protein